jgi:hypothetical protein
MNIANALSAIGTCQQMCCQDICNPSCNPVTNQGCNAANMEACDSDGAGGFTCFAGTMGVAICQMCDENMGPFCSPGMTCVNAECAQYCCNDGDCGSTGTCDMTQGPVDNEMKVGVCLFK